MIKKSVPSIKHEIDIPELNLSPGQNIEFFLEHEGFIKLHLTENNKLVILHNNVDLIVDEWHGHMPYKKKIRDIEDES